MRTDDADVKLMLGGTEVILMPERAMCFPHAQTLVIAGLHPSDQDADHALDEEALHRIERAAFRASARRLVIAGSLPQWSSTHEENAADPFEEFRKRLPLPLLHIEGNDRRRARTLPHAWFVQTARMPCTLDGASTGGSRFQFESTATATQEDPSTASHWTIATDVHPVFAVTTAGKRMTLPVFVVDEALQRITLPAASRSCRGVRIERGEGLRLFAASNGKVIVLT
ncbi:MAG: hypothetical protein EXS10_04640 [Phycisphaerales bacterium]|nr:hypothetical protein [Phycisphaerales bacterium]